MSAEDFLKSYKVKYRITASMEKIATDAYNAGFNRLHEIAHELLIFNSCPCLRRIEAAIRADKGEKA